MTQPSTPPYPSSSLAGRLFLAGIGLSIAMLGMFFVWLMARSFLRARDMNQWPKVPCVILISEIEERKHDPNSPTEYRQNLSFGYEWLGEPRTGDRLTLRGSSWSSKRELADQRVTAYPEGSTKTCYVNPKDPDLAVLQPDSLAPGYSIWFPSLFVVGGLMIAWRTISPRRLHHIS